MQNQFKKLFIVTNLLLLYLVNSTNNAYAQEIQRQFYGNGGNAVHTSEVSLSQTFGEPLNIVFEKYDPSLTKTIFLQQGFEQNKADTSVFTYTQNNLQFSAEIYPNPTASFIELHLNIKEIDGLIINIFDGLGRSIVINIEVFETTIIDASNFVQGVYFIHLNNSQSQSIASFPFIKI